MATNDFMRAFELTVHTTPKTGKSLEKFSQGFLRPAGISSPHEAMTPPETPDSLSEALRQWRVQPPRNPDFRPSVWRRIRQSTSETWAGYLRQHLAAWSLAAAVVVTAAGWGGHAVAQAKLNAERETMVVAYLVELDPRVQAGLRR